jgi:hypothetical protein
VSGEEVKTLRLLWLTIGIALSLACAAHCDPAPPVTIALADRAIGESVAVGLTGAYDLYTTGLALSRCPLCREGNPLGPNVETRVSMKAAGTLGAVSLIWFLESHGRHKAALGLAIGASLAQFLAGTHNAVLAARRH